MQPRGRKLRVIHRKTRRGACERSAGRCTGSRSSEQTAASISRYRVSPVLLVSPPTPLTLTQALAPHLEVLAHGRQDGLRLAQHLGAGDAREREGTRNGQVEGVLASGIGEGERRVERK